MRVTVMKLFNLLISPIGRVASRPMRNVETSSSKQMYLYLSLVERKVAEFYHNTWLKWLVFIAFSGQLMVSLLEWGKNLHSSDYYFERISSKMELIETPWHFLKLHLFLQFLVTKCLFIFIGISECSSREKFWF